MTWRCSRCLSMSDTGGAPLVCWRKGEREDGTALRARADLSAAAMGLHDLGHDGERPARRRAPGRTCRARSAGTSARDPEAARSDRAVIADLDAAFLVRARMASVPGGACATFAVYAGLGLASFHIADEARVRSQTSRCRQRDAHATESRFAAHAAGAPFELLSPPVRDGTLAELHEVSDELLATRRTGEGVLYGLVRPHYLRCFHIGV